MKLSILFGAGATVLAASLSAHAGNALDSTLKCENVKDRNGNPAYTVYISSRGKSRDAFVAIQPKTGALINLPNDKARLTNSWMDLNEEKVFVINPSNNKAIMWIEVKQKTKPSPAAAAVQAKVDAAVKAGGDAEKTQDDAIAQAVIAGQPPVEAAGGSPNALDYQGKIEFKNLGQNEDMEAKDKAVECSCGIVKKDAQGELNYSTWAAKSDGCTPNIPGGA